jgi:hypothetical protein
VSHAENKFTREGYKNNNLYDKIKYCRLIEFADDISEIHIKIRKTRE